MPNVRQLAACAGIGATMLVTNAAAPNPNRAAISRRLTGGAHVRRKGDGFGQQLRLDQLMQRQPDGAFVLASAAAISATEVSPSHSRQTRAANSVKQLAAWRLRS